MSSEDRSLLRAVRSANGEYVAPEGEITRMAKLLQTHVLLPHRNSTWWYEIHPLAERFVGPAEE